MKQFNAVPASIISSLQGFKGFEMQSRFKLIQYFTATSLVAFGFVAVTLVYFQMRQSDFFKSVQTEEIRSSQETHGKLISNAEQVARVQGGGGQVGRVVHEFGDDQSGRGGGGDGRGIVDGEAGAADDGS